MARVWAFVVLLGVLWVGTFFEVVGVRGLASEDFYRWPVLVFLPILAVVVVVRALTMSDAT